MHRNVNKNQRLKQLPVSNMSTWSENGEDIFVVFHENMRQGNCIVAIPRSDVSFCLSLNCSVQPLFSIPWQPRFPKCLYRNRKVDKKCRVFQHNWSVSYFLRMWMGYLYVWCVHSRFQWWKNITFDTTMRLIMPKDTVACKGNRWEKRWRNW